MLLPNSVQLTQIQRCEFFKCFADQLLWGTQYLWKTWLCLRNRTIWKVSRRHYRRRSMTAVLDHFQYTSDCLSPSPLIRWVMFALHHWCPSLMWCWPDYSTCNLQNCSVKKGIWRFKNALIQGQDIGAIFQNHQSQPNSKKQEILWTYVKEPSSRQTESEQSEEVVCTLLKTSRALQMDAWKVQLSALSHAILTANKEHPWHSHNSSCSTENTHFCHQEWYMRIHNIVCQKPIVYSFPQLPRSCKNNFKWLKMLHFQPSNFQNPL